MAYGRVLCLDVLSLQSKKKPKSFGAANCYVINIADLLRVGVGLEGGGGEARPACK